MDADIAVPNVLSSIRPYMMIYKQFKKRDPVVSYYAVQYATQIGIEVAKSNPEAKSCVVSLLDRLEVMKEEQRHKDAVDNEIVGEAHVEDVGLKLFEYADREDREGNFNKSLVKAFFTASHIFSIAGSLRGELSEEIETKQKYAKWKAVEIDRCLKSGIQPTPGPPGGLTGADDTASPADDERRQPSPKPTPKPRQNIDSSAHPPYPPANIPSGYPPGDPPGGVPTPYPPGAVPTPYPPGAVPTGLSAGVEQPQPSSGGPSTGEVTKSVSPEDVSKAQKMCKFASSALDYDDVAGAVDYLSQALRLLKKPT